MGERSFGLGAKPVGNNHRAEGGGSRGGSLEEGGGTSWEKRAHFRIEYNKNVRKGRVKLPSTKKGKKVLRKCYEVFFPQGSGRGDKGKKKKKPNGGILKGGKLL